MPSLAERQGAFAAAILSPDAPEPSGLTVPTGASGPERFAVYRNNVAVSLIEALRSAFPVVNRLVGAEFFTAMAREHALECPPSSPVLLAYGGGFPDFIAGFEAAAELPYLADVARLEWLWLEAYHAAEAEPLTIAALAHIAPEHLPELIPALHPATRFARFDHPALTIWQAHQGDGEPEPIEIGDVPEHVLIVRPEAEVAVFPVTAGAIAFLAAIARGRTIGDAAGCALEVEPDADLSAMLPAFFGAGALATHTYGAVAPEFERGEE